MSRRLRHVEVKHDGTGRWQLQEVIGILKLLLIILFLLPLLHDTVSLLQLILQAQFAHDPVHSHFRVHRKACCRVLLAPQTQLLGLDL